MVWLVLLDFSQGGEPIFVSNCSWSMPSFKETVLLVLNFKMEAGGHPASFKNLLADVELIEHTFVYSNTVARDYHTYYWSDRQVLAS